MKTKNVLEICLIVIAVAFIALFAGGLFVLWKLNSYTAGNWRAEYGVREYIEIIFPELDYEIVSRKLYETKFHGTNSVVWEFTIKCEGDDETYTVYDINRKVSGTLYWDIADYAEIYFDYDEKIMDDIDEAYDLGAYRVSLDNEFVRSSRYEFNLTEDDQMDDVVEKISYVYDGALAASKGSWPVEIICMVSYGDKEKAFFTRDFYSKGTVTMDENERKAYIREKLEELK